MPLKQHGHNLPESELYHSTDAENVFRAFRVRIPVIEASFSLLNLIGLGSEDPVVEGVMGSSEIQVVLWSTE